MADVRLQFQRNAESVIVVVKMGRGQNSWRVMSPPQSPKWFPEREGTWTRRVTSATKFSTNYSVVLEGRGSSAYIPQPPYEYNQKFNGTTYSQGGWLDSGNEIAVTVMSSGGGSRKFRIRELTAGSLSYGVGQAEVAFFEILDPDAKPVVSAIYLYKGAGLGLSVNLPKIPKIPIRSIPGSGSFEGDWTDFEAPGALTVNDFEGDARLDTILNAGLGSSYSITNLWMFGDDNFPAKGIMAPLNTGRTISLPSTGWTSGSLTRCGR